MVTIRLIYDMPRTTRNWPPYGDTCEVSDQEAERLVRHGWAEYLNDEADDEEPKTDELYEAPDYDEPDDDDFGYGSVDADDDPEVDEIARPPRALVVKKPRTVDPKSKWLEFARSRGYEGDDTITKNRLIAQYGD